MTSKNWCFTLFSESLADIDLIADPVPAPIALWKEDKMNFLIYQLEEAPDTHRRHLQGFVQLKKKARVTGAKKCFEPHSPHFEIMRGTSAEAKAYCEKEDSRVAGPWTWGELIVQGSRTDLASAAKAIKEGASKRKIAEDYPEVAIKFSKGLDSYRHTLDKCPKWRDLIVTYIWGEPGVGKTRAVWDSVDDPTKLYKVEGDGRWWDGYDGQDAILFDDFRGQVPFIKMLAYLDGHPSQMEVKGGWVYAKWTKVWITANRPKEEQYKKKHSAANENESWMEDLLTEAERAAWDRRITEVINMV